MGQTFQKHDVKEPLTKNYRQKNPSTPLTFTFFITFAHLNNFT